MPIIIQIHFIQSISRRGITAEIYRREREALKETMCAICHCLKDLCRVTIIRYYLVCKRICLRLPINQREIVQLCG